MWRRSERRLRRWNRRDWQRWRRTRRQRSQRETRFRSERRRWRRRGQRTWRRRADRWNGYQTVAVWAGHLLTGCGRWRLEQAAAQRAVERNQFLRRAKGRGRRRRGRWAEKWRRRLRRGWRLRIAEVKRRSPAGEIERRRFLRPARRRADLRYGQQAPTKRALDLCSSVSRVDLDGPVAVRAVERNNRHQTVREKSVKRSAKCPV